MAVLSFALPSSHYLWNDMDAVLVSIRARNDCENPRKDAVAGLDDMQTSCLLSVILGQFSAGSW